MVFGIAYGKVIDRHRKAGRTHLTDETPDVVDDSDSAKTCLVAGQETAHVQHCLGTLSDEHRSAVALAFWKEMSCREIAAMADTAEGTIKTRIFHAKKLLMRCLTGRMERSVV